MNCNKCGEMMTESSVGLCSLPLGKQVPTVANMTLHDWFMGQALMGMMASRNPTSPRFHPEDDAAYVHAVADAMLKAREVKP
jgi:hypothetical protein